MRIITERQEILGVAERWKNNYCKPGGEWYTLHKNISAGFIYSRLYELDLNTATAKQVNDIIGNESWTRIKCDECEENKTELIDVGQKEDYESRTACICFDCLKKANELVVKFKNDG